MSLQTSMDKLSQVLLEIDGDLDVSVEVTAKINDDVPTGFNTTEPTALTEFTRYRKNIDVIGGKVMKSIVLYIAD